MKFSSINQKVMAAGAAVFLLATATAGSGLWAAMHLSTALTRAMQSSEVLRTHMDADMMHDALRADMLMALRSADPTSGVTIADVKKDVAEHVQRFRDDNKQARELALDDASRQALDAIKAPLVEYIGGAEALADLAGKDPVAAKAAMPKFLVL